jgi:transposase, IS5 family
LFEPHADIIAKGARHVQYGHKLNLTSGRSGLILDLVIEAGNPADSERFLPMLERHIAFYGQPPRQTAADGGFASRDNPLRSASGRPRFVPAGGLSFGEGPARALENGP